ncbi:MAG: iron ABC transporter permease [Victivallales bacterium]|nr:iron ABC transporter permease [Victivallales bacterium]
MPKGNNVGRLVCLIALAVVALLLAPFCGIKLISPADVVSGAEASIFWRMRVPRVLLAFAAGAVLSLGGMVFQSLFRNSLATPYTLGVSGGAALGVAAALRFGATTTLLGQGISGISAFVGAVIVTLLVFGVCRLRRRRTPEDMLLAGVAVSILCSNAIILLQYIGDESRLFQTMRWMMGSVTVTGYRQTIAMLALCIVPVVLIILHAKEMDLLQVGGDFAASRGVAVSRSRNILFISVSFMVAVVVSVCGPIGFIGMICPHICRRIYGASHSTLAPASLMFGGAFLVACDAIARCAAAPTELPVGIITAMLGCPFFLWLIYRGRFE